MTGGFVNITNLTGCNFSGGSTPAAFAALRFGSAEVDPEVVAGELWGVALAEGVALGTASTLSVAVVVEGDKVDCADANGEKKQTMATANTKRIIAMETPARSEFENLFALIRTLQRVRVLTRRESEGLRHNAARRHAKAGLDSPA